MSYVLDQQKQQQIVGLGRVGWPVRRIAAATGVDRATVRGYLLAAGIPVRGRGRPGEEPAKPAISGAVSTDVVKTAPTRAPSVSACEPYRELIAEALGRGRNAVAIWQDLVDDHGFGAGYASVRRFVVQLRGASPPEARVVITTAPGEEAQVDYGEGPMVRDPATGKYRRTRLFVFTLGYSRKAVRLLIWKSSAQLWAELHERAFRRLGGTVKVIVLDNLREGVLTPDVYDPAINPLYRDVLAHYGVVALPCRVRDPDRKGKVEASVGHAQKTPLKGVRFETIEAAQAYLDRWDARWADTRIHGTTKRQVAAMFAEERPTLGPLPIEPFRYYRFGERTVHLDGCVEVEAAYYGVPPGWIGHRVQVQWNDLHVRLLAPKTGQLLREHLRAPRGWHRIAEDDRPARTPSSTVALLARAATAGAHISAVCTSIHQHDGASGVRRILGVLALAKKHGVAVVEDAATTALEIGVPTYRFLRKYLERRPPVPLTLRQVDPIIRQLTLYRDLIDRKTGDLS
jgi:transposase